MASTLPEPRRRMTAIERQQQILRTAERLFAEQGFGQVTMDQIAQEIGVTKPVIYDYFSSKDNLLVAITARLRAGLFEATQAALVGRTEPEDLLRHGVLAFFTFVDANHQAWTVLNREAAKVSGEAAAELDELRRQQAGLTTALVSTIGSDVDQAEAEAVAEMINGASEWVARWRETRPEVTAAMATEYLMGIFWTGLAARVR